MNRIIEEAVANYDPSKEYTSEAEETEEQKLAGRVKMYASLEGLNVFIASRVRDLEQLIALLIMRGSINPDNLEGDVLDFGTGTGAGAYILKQYGGNVTGVDIYKEIIATTVKEGILPQERAIVKDGFQYLAGLEAGSLDFISAFMMQCEFPFERLYSEAKRVLRPSGQLLITVSRTESKDELQRYIGGYGKVEDVLTLHDDTMFGNYAFTYTKG